MVLGVRRVRSEVGAGRLGDGRRPGREQRIELRLRARQRRARRETSDQIQKMAAAILPVGRIDDERQPHLDVVVGDVEVRRHHADDGPARRR